MPLSNLRSQTRSFWAERIYEFSLNHEKPKHYLVALQSCLSFFNISCRAEFLKKVLDFLESETDENKS